MAKTYNTKSVQIILLFIFAFLLPCNAQFPIVINTWRFTTAAEKAWQVIQDSSALDTIEQGCSVCEIEQCDRSVGYGGSPDESGETTLDAMIMNGVDLNVGAVSGIRRIKSAISVARRVLENTFHSMLAGDLATKFAIEMGFKEETLSTNSSTNVWKAWKDRNCQPNYRIHVKPNPAKSCGPYTPIKNTKISRNMEANVGTDNHDTIGMVAIDKSGNIAAGTSTNGLQHKIPGRVGDSPVPGAGAYADNTVGGAAATGDGDVMMRFLPSFLAVEEMRRGTSPGEAAKIAIMRITKYHPNFFGGVIAINKEGVYGAACNGMKEFPFSIANPTTNKVNIEIVPCQENFVMQF